MAGVAGSGSQACGHLVPPGSGFCPVCGQPATGGSAPSQPESESWDSWFAPGRPPPFGPQPWPAPPGNVPRPSSTTPARPPAPALFSSPPAPDGGQPPPTDPDATWVDLLGSVPPGDVPTAMLDDLLLAPAPGGPRRSRRPLIALIVAVALVAGVLIFWAHSIIWAHSGSTAASGTTSATPSASPQDARQAAVQLSGLLAQSATDRVAVIDATADVGGCGPSLHRDAQTFARAASSRKRLLSGLGSLPDRSLLPAAMLADLTGAWQASAQVDTDLAQWTDDQIAHGCHRDGPPDAHLLAANIPESQATADKHAFASLWNPVARRYGLATYQWNQL